MRPIGQQKQRTKSRIMKIYARLKEKSDSFDDKILNDTYLNMMSYMADGTNSSLEDIKKLLESLQRSILCIQRHKKKIVENKNRRYK